MAVHQQPFLSPWLCTLEFHDDAFSTDNVVVNADRVPSDSILTIGSLARVVPLKASARIEGPQPLNLADASARLDKSPRYGAEKRSARAWPKTTRFASRNPLGQQQRLAEQTDPNRSVVFIVSAMTAGQRAKRPSLQCSLHMSVRRAFGFFNRQQIVVQPADRSAHTATHVELAFRDQYLARADLWQLTSSEISGQCVFKGQTVSYMNSIKVTVRSIYVQGRKVASALVSPTTVPILRSEAARYLYCVQMSQEMWDYDTEGSGDIMFSKLVDGFFPDLFRRWKKANVRHYISIILFARTEYEKGVLRVPDRMPRPQSSTRDLDDEYDYRDHYKVIDTERCTDWNLLLRDLKKQFRTFLRDILTVPVEQTYGRRPDRLSNVRDTEEIRGSVIAGRPTSATKGNLLEVINMASPWFAMDHVDRDMARTGRALVIITAGTGVFDVDYDLLKMTTEMLVSNTRAIDIVSLSPMPLHSVPLFRYKAQYRSQFGESQPGSAAGSFTPRQPLAMLSHSQSPLKASMLGTTIRERRPSEEQMNTLKESQWAYAVPHWLDVSFWTPDYDANTYQDYRPAHVNSKTGFATRCRMYELQMMGLMESEMTNVTIPLLDLFADNTKNGALRSNSATQARNPLSLSKELVKGNSHMLSTSPSNSLRKDAMSSVMSPADNVTRQILTSWMDQYDEQTVRVSQQTDLAASPTSISGHVGPAAKHRPLNLKHNVSEHDFAKRPVPQTSNMSEAGDDGGDDRSIKSVSTTGFKAAKIKAQGKDAAPLKSPGLPRQISMGPKGLGPLKSTATTSVTSTSTASINTSDVVSSGVMARTASKSTGLLTRQLMSTLTKRTSQPTFFGSRGNKARSVDSENTEEDDGSRTSAAPSVPIAIAKDGKDGQNSDSPSDEANEYAKTVRPDNRKGTLARLGPNGSRLSQGQLSMAESINSIRDRTALPRGLSPVVAMSQWLTVLNPFNPTYTHWTKHEQPRRWQHIFPRSAPRMKIKWRSFCSTSAYPLTSRYMPSVEDLCDLFDSAVHSIVVHPHNTTVAASREFLLRQMIASRLSRGFQFISGPSADEYCKASGLTMCVPFDRKITAVDGLAVLLTCGNNIHRLRCHGGDRIEIKRFIRKSSRFGTLRNPADVTVTYEARVKMILMRQYEKRLITFMPPRQEYDWSTIDGFLNGDVRLLSAPNLPYIRARYVLIPVPLSRSTRLALGHPADVPDDEIRVEGIMKLTQLFQRARMFRDGEERPPSLTLPNDPGPLAIDFQTRDPSAVVRSYAAGNGGNVMFGEQHMPTLAPHEIHNVGDYDIHKVAQQMHADHPKGVPIYDRRWHWRLCAKAFRGDEFTTWLTVRFRGIESREDAVKLGNELMRRGLFSHVGHKVEFRDGFFFYQVQAAFRRTQQAKIGTGWFSRMTERSIPTTPIHDEIVRPQSGSPISGRSQMRTQNDDALIQPSSEKLSDHSVIQLDRVLSYDMDPRRRSWRPEVLMLHYDRIHNPENCFRIRIHWMNVTSKCIEDTIQAWATCVERYGLKVVELPIAEACKIGENDNYRATEKIKLAVKPPPLDAGNRNYFDLTSFPALAHDEPFPMQRAILRKWDFVLDAEAAHRFEVPNMTITHSYGPPNYTYTQFVHRLGGTIVQVDNQGDFLLLSNHLSANRATVPKDATKLERLEKDHQIALSKENQVGLSSSTRSPLASPLLRASSVQAPPFAGNATGGSGSSTPTTGGLSSAINGARQATTNVKVPILRTFTAQRCGKPKPNSVEIFLAFEAWCHDKEVLTAFYEEVLSHQQDNNHSLHPGAPSVMSSTSSAEPSPSSHATLASLSPRDMPLRNNTVSASQNSSPHMGVPRHFHTHAAHAHHPNLSMRSDSEIPTLGGMQERSTTANSTYAFGMGGTIPTSNPSAPHDTRTTGALSSGVGIFQRALSYGLSSSTGTVVYPSSSSVTGPTSASVGTAPANLAGPSAQSVTSNATSANASASASIAEHRRSSGDNSSMTSGEGG